MLLTFRSHILTTKYSEGKKERSLLWLARKLFSEGAPEDFLSYFIGQTPLPFLTLGNGKREYNYPWPVKLHLRSRFSGSDSPEVHGCVQEKWIPEPKSCSMMKGYGWEKECWVGHRQCPSYSRLCPSCCGHIFFVSVSFHGMGMIILVFSWRRIWVYKVIWFT